MKITISQDRTFFDIQEEFSKVFPYLKIEFFKKKPKQGEQFEQKQVKYKSKTLAEYSTTAGNGNIIITPKMTVANLEKSFNNEYGLKIKVYRNSWRVWLEATVTDGWTLEEQNKQGEALSGKNI